MRYLKTYENKRESKYRAGDYVWVDFTEDSTYPCAKIIYEFWDGTFLIEILDFEENMILEIVLHYDILREATSDEIETYEFYKSTFIYNL